jgi:hypothetical protein
MSCPELAPWEREIAVVDKCDRLRKGNFYEDGKEEELRIEHKCPARNNNPLLQDETIKIKHTEPEDPTARYCRYCKYRCHATSLCTTYCPLCETKGHGSQTCTKEGAWSQRRNTKWAEWLKEQAQKLQPRNN